MARGELPEIQVVFFEGDRLFNASFLMACSEVLPASRFFVLQAPEYSKAIRRSRRGDTKPEQFLRGRAAKYRNILDHRGISEGVRVETLDNETPEQLERNVAMLYNLLTGPLTERS